MDIYQMTKEQLALRINWGVVDPFDVDWKMWLYRHGTHPVDSLELWDYSKIGDLLVLLDKDNRLAVEISVEAHFNTWLTIFIPEEHPFISQEEFDKYFHLYSNGWFNEWHKYLDSLFPPEEESNQGGSPTENQPTPDAISLPPELDTENARKYLSRAINVDYIKPTDNGGYEWVFGEKYRGRGARLGYFVSKVYDKPRPITPLESLFGVKNLSANVCQAEPPANRADVVKWRTEIDRTIFYD